MTKKEITETLVAWEIAIDQRIIALENLSSSEASGYINNLRRHKEAIEEVRKKLPNFSVEHSEYWRVDLRRMGEDINYSIKNSTNIIDS